MLLDRELTEERSLSDSDSKLNTLVSEASSKLREISASVQDLLRPDDEAPPRYDDAVLSGMVEDLQLRVENDRELLRERDEKLLAELEEKPAILRDLSARVGKQKQMAQVKVARVMVGVQDTRPASNTNGDDTALLLQGAVLPVATFLIVSLFVTVLSQQFVRVATAWRRRQWAKAEKARKIQLRRFQTFQRTASRAWDELQQGKFEEARDDFGELFRFLERWSSEPTWEELFRAEGAAFWERWGPGAFRLEATLPGIQAAPKEGPEMGRWVAERWADSAQNVIKGYALGALRDWAKEGGPAPSAGNASASSQAPQPTGLVIRIFGRWPREPWVNVANLPLAGDWREKALRLLLPAEKDVQDLPIIGPLCDTALTAVVSSQVTRVVKTSVWGSLTTDLWTADARRGRPANGGTQEAFQIGYEVVEVNSQVPDDMCALAREMPVSGTPGRVVRVRPEIENTLGSLDAS